MFHLKTLSIPTTKTFEIINLTQQVQAYLVEIGAKNGLINVFTRHTTAIIKINEAEQ